MFYSATQKGPYRVPGYHDPDDSRLIGITFRPDVWQADTTYYHNDDDNYDVVIPTTFAGRYYRCASPGKSHATTEPTWTFVDGEETTDGSTGLIWLPVDYNLMPPTETVSLVTFTADPAATVTLSNTSYTDTSCQFMIDPFTAGTLKTFDVTCHVTKSNTEEFDVTLRFKIADR